MSNSVPPSRAGGRKAPRGPRNGSSGLYSPQGARKYLTRSERRRVVAVMAARQSDASLLALTLAWTGARVSEVLALTPEAFQIDLGVVALVTLKRRRLTVREVPIPRELMAALDRRYGLAAAQRDQAAAQARLWPCCRSTAWRHIKSVMTEAGVSGRPASPRGLRHGFGVGTLQAGVPLTLLQRWLGHARLTTTAIYAEVTGLEEQAAARAVQDGVADHPVALRRNGAFLSGGGWHGARRPAKTVSAGMPRSR